ncbi:MAG: protein kinase domain-containing protein, partial [Acidimicrobiales bacterium]
MSRPSFSARHRRRATIVATVLALLAALASATPAGASLTGNEPITTIAGTGNASYGGDNGPATNADLYNPFGIAIDGDGNLYIADTYNHRIRHVDTNGIITTIAGTGSFGPTGDGGPATSATLSGPSAIAVDNDGN